MDLDRRSKYLPFRTKNTPLKRRTTPFGTKKFNATMITNPNKLSRGQLITAKNRVNETLSDNSSGTWRNIRKLDAPEALYRGENLAKIRSAELREKVFNTYKTDSNGNIVIIKTQMVIMEGMMEGKRSNFPLMQAYEHAQAIMGATYAVYDQKSGELLSLKKLSGRDFLNKLKTSNPKGKKPSRTSGKEWFRYQ
ncbi:MAG: hypothetical protein Q7S21_04690 [archaeon]|nr:hypothetical protein [archaeon]